jgi:hypothetical protein
LIQVGKLIGHRHGVKAIDVAPVAHHVMGVGEPIVLGLLLLDLPLLLMHYLLLLGKVVL